MQPAKVDVLVILFAYGGNGGTASIIPELALWLTRTVIKMKANPRIGRIQPEILSDTPITLTRNKAIRMAQELGYDMVLMLDSDNEPDGYVGADPHAKPFWDVAFDFAYDRLVKGEPTVIAAPYCGPPPHPVDRPGCFHGGEVPYLFQWIDNESDIDNPHRKLEMLTRNEAARLSGIHPVAALPTGVCLFTTNAFDGAPKPYFDYEWNEDHSEKASTEDVYCTRNLSLFWKMKHDLDVIYAACDSWALHHKPKRVGRPRVTPVEALAKNFRESLADPVSVKEAKKFVDCTQDLPRRGQVLGPDDDYVYISDEELEQASVLVERESGPDADVLSVLPPEQSPATVAPSQEDEMSPLDDDFVFEPAEEPVNNHEPALEYTMVRGRKVAVFNDFRVSEDDLDGVDAITSWLVSRKGGALEVAVLNSGTGQATAVINSVLPEGSHIYALDCFTPHQYSTVPAEQFNLSFAPEIERGRIQPDNLDRKMPEPSEKQHLDMVFSEQFATAEKLERWYEHVQPGGLIAGLGYGKKAKPVVNKFIKQHKLQLKTQGDVWAIPVPATKEVVQAEVAEPAVDEDDERVDLYVESYDGERF